jgi:ABC-type maltose transport system permease subunit
MGWNNNKKYFNVAMLHECFTQCFMLQCCTNILFNVSQCFTASLKLSSSSFDPQQAMSESLSFSLARRALSFSHHHHHPFSHTQHNNSVQITRARQYEISVKERERDEVEKKRLIIYFMMLHLKKQTQ